MGIKKPSIEGFSLKALVSGALHFNTTSLVAVWTGLELMLQLLLNCDYYYILLGLLFNFVYFCLCS